MLHRQEEIHERYMLHPALADVVAGLVGPDVLALQTMLFVKGAPARATTRTRTTSSPSRTR
jgi:hypothetical protein